MGCCFSLENERNGEKTGGGGGRDAYHHQHHRERVLRHPRSSLFLSLSYSCSSGTLLFINNTASLAKKEENESVNGRRERAGGRIKEGKKKLLLAVDNCDRR